MTAPIEHDAIDPEALTQMRERGGTWSAYRNEALDSANCGHLQFLKYGEGCTYETPPAQYPMDNEHGMGWRYLLLGRVNLETGLIEPMEETNE